MRSIIVVGEADLQPLAKHYPTMTGEHTLDWPEIYPSIQDHPLQVLVAVADGGKGVVGTPLTDNAPDEGQKVNPLLDLLPWKSSFRLEH